MESLKQTFEKFLKEQKERVAKRTFTKYKDVIYLFESYLDSYAYQYLDEEDYELYEDEMYSCGTEYCEMFSIDKISGIEIDEFMTYFMIRKVMGSKELMKNTGTVLRRFIKWLKENSYINNKKFDMLYSTVNENKNDLPKVEELADLLYDHGSKNIFYQYNQYEEDNFLITKVEEGKLWLESYMKENKKVGPVKVSKRISSLAQEGWSVYLVLGKKGNSWYIVESGNVYPY
ncbi:MAG: hypothetical protein KGY44_06840 [Halanaerobiales bacterium]|nr:hypothetical protein [Halanaerobiales bacterium]